MVEVNLNLSPKQFRSILLTQSIRYYAGQAKEIAPGPGVQVVEDSR